MRIVYHLGAHCTDEDRLVRCLFRNREVLANEGILVPSPARYRKLVRNAAIPPKDEIPPSEAEILDTIIGDQKGDRLILSWEYFLNFPAWAVNGSLYPDAGPKVMALRRVFPSFETELHFAIRNMATFLPALRSKALAQSTCDILDGIDPLALSWVPVIQNILQINPGVPLTVWCDEETPFIWPEVLQAVSGHRPETELTSTDGILAVAMSDAGLTRMTRYLAEYPAKSASRRRKVIGAFLERFARLDEIVMEIDLPDWTQDLVDELTQRYLADVATIREIPGVTMIEA